MRQYLQGLQKLQPLSPRHQYDVATNPSMHPSMQYRQPSKQYPPNRLPHISPREARDFAMKFNDDGSYDEVQSNYSLRYTPTLAPLSPKSSRRGRSHSPSPRDSGESGNSLAPLPPRPQTAHHMSPSRDYKNFIAPVPPRPMSASAAGQYVSPNRVYTNALRHVSPRSRPQSAPMSPPRHQNVIRSVSPNSRPHQDFRQVSPGQHRSLSRDRTDFVRGNNFDGMMPYCKHCGIKGVVAYVTAIGNHHSTSCPRFSKTPVHACEYCGFVMGKPQWVALNGNHHATSCPRYGPDPSPYFQPGTFDSNQAQMTVGRGDNGFQTGTFGGNQVYMTTGRGDDSFQTGTFDRNRGPMTMGRADDGFQLGTFGGNQVQMTTGRGDDYCQPCTTFGGNRVPMRSGNMDDGPAVYCNSCGIAGTEAWISANGNHHTPSCPQYSSKEVCHCEHCAAVGEVEWMTMNGKHHNQHCPLYSNLVLSTCTSCGLTGKAEWVAANGDHHSQECRQYSDIQVVFCNSCGVVGTMEWCVAHGNHHSETCSRYSTTTMEPCQQCGAVCDAEKVSMSGKHHHSHCPLYTVNEIGTCQVCGAVGKMEWINQNGNHHDKQCVHYADIEVSWCRNCNVVGRVEWVSACGSHHHKSCPRWGDIETIVCNCCGVVGKTEWVTASGRHHAQSCPRYSDLEVGFCKHCGVVVKASMAHADGSHHEIDCPLFSDFECRSCPHCSAAGPVELMSTHGRHHESHCPKYSKDEVSVCGTCFAVGAPNLISSKGNHHTPSCSLYSNMEVVSCKHCNAVDRPENIRLAGKHHRSTCPRFSAIDVASCDDCGVVGKLEWVTMAGSHHLNTCPRFLATEVSFCKHCGVVGGKLGGNHHGTSCPRYSNVEVSSCEHCGVIGTVEWIQLKGNHHTPSCPRCAHFAVSFCKYCGVIGDVDCVHCRPLEELGTALAPQPSPEVDKGIAMSSSAGLPKVGEALASGASPVAAESSAAKVVREDFTVGEKMEMPEALRRSLEQGSLQQSISRMDEQISMLKQQSAKKSCANQAAAARDMDDIEKFDDNEAAEKEARLQKDRRQKQAIEAVLSGTINLEKVSTEILELAIAEKENREKNTKNKASSVGEGQQGNGYGTEQSLSRSVTRPDVGTQQVKDECPSATGATLHASGQGGHCVCDIGMSSTNMFRSQWSGWQACQFVDEASPRVLRSGDDAPGHTNRLEAALFAGDAPSHAEEAKVPEWVIEEARAIFKTLDRDRNNSVSKIELIVGLKKCERVREVFRLPAQIRQEDAATRRDLEDTFQNIDRDGNKELSWEEFELWIRENPCRWNAMEQRRGDAVKPANPQADGNEYTVVLDKREGAQLGFGLDTSDATILVIVRIMEEGLAADWNERNQPSHQLMPGDCILEVNGIRHDSKKMLDECTKDAHLTFRLRRKVATQETSPPFEGGLAELRKENEALRYQLATSQFENTTGGTGDTAASHTPQRPQSATKRQVPFVARSLTCVPHEQRTSLMCVPHV